MKPGAFLVTGGSSGIGAAIARQLAVTGRRVGVISRTGEPKAQDAWGAPDPKVDWIEANLADAVATGAAVATWSARINHAIDGLVLSAVDYGFPPRHPILSSTLAEFDRLWMVNLRSQFVMLSLVLPALVARQRAVILTISSSAALGAAPGRAMYGATKAGSLALFRSLAEELGSTGVSVIQALPQNQVKTPGIQARRPQGFAFEDYDTPSIFEPLTKHMQATLGAGMNGAILSIDSSGHWHDIMLPR